MNVTFVDYVMQIQSSITFLLSIAIYDRNNIVHLYYTQCNAHKYHINETTFNKNTHKIIQKYVHIIWKDQDRAWDVTQGFQQELHHNNKSVIINLFSGHSCKYYLRYHLKRCSKGVRTQNMSDIRCRLKGNLLLDNA